MDIMEGEQGLKKFQTIDWYVRWADKGYKNEAYRMEETIHGKEK